jgi:hypothetical protein
VSSAESQPWLPEQFEFLAGIPEPERQGKVCLMMQAYIDDSGTKGTHPIFTLAGFIGPAEKWAALSNSWREYLKASPSIDYLKMKEAAKLDGEFNRWEPKDRNDKLHGFIDIIKRHAPQKAIHVTIDLKDFERHMAPNLYQPMSSPYFVGAHAILAGIGHEILDSGAPLEEPEIFFDEQLIFGPRLKMWYPLIKAAMKERKDYDLGRLYTALPNDLMFRDDKIFVPLQAADVLAWLVRMGYTGVPNEFEWIVDELSPLIPLSEYSAFYDARRMKRVHRASLKMAIPLSLLRDWQEEHGIVIARKKRRKKKRRKRGVAAYGR